MDFELRWLASCKHDEFLFYHPMPPDVALGRAAFQLPLWLRTIPSDQLPSLGPMDKAIATDDDKNLPKQFSFKDKESPVRHKGATACKYADLNAFIEIEKKGKSDHSSPF